jgi:streptomycin 6-kinase
LRNEIAALQAYDRRGAVRLIDADDDRGALLLERVLPGDMLSTIEDDDKATRIAAGVMRKLRCPSPKEHSFPAVADWARGMDRLRVHYRGGTGPFPKRLIEEAESLFADLLPSQGEPVLLHGDLHHFNILRHGDGWLSIDPKGVVGEAEYEVGALLRNPDPERLARPEAVALQTRRIEILAEELGFDKKRLRDWAVAQAVLSGWWGVEDGGELSDTWISCMERLSEVQF